MNLMLPSALVVLMIRDSFTSQKHDIREAFF